MNRDPDQTPPPATVVRIFKQLLAALQARASYTTRVWTALFLPLALGTVLGWSTRAKLEGLALGGLAVIVYTVFHLLWKKYLK